MSEILSKYDEFEGGLASAIRTGRMAAEGVLTLGKYGLPVGFNSIVSRLRGQPMDHSEAIAGFAREITEVILHHSDMKLVVEANIEPLQPNERVIVVGNHGQTKTTLFPSIHGVCEYLTGNLLAVGKKQMLYDPLMLPPFLGWPAWLADIMLFVRRGREKDIAAVNRGCKKSLRPGRAALVFPDAHRPTLPRIIEAQKLLHEKYPPDQYPELAHEVWQYTGFPRSTAFLTVLRAVEDCNHVRVINLTTACDRDENRENTRGGTIYVDLAEVPLQDVFLAGKDLEVQEEHLRQWLMREWTRKNKWTHDLRQSNSNELA